MHWVVIMQAFVLIGLKNCNERKLLQELRSYEQIRHLYVLFGEWDVLAEVEVESTEELGTFIMDNIRSRPDVNLTSSLIVANK